MISAQRTFAIIVGCALAMSGCGGGGSSESGGQPAPPPPPPKASPGGIWQGTQTFDGDTMEIIGLVTESGRFHFIREDDAQFFGQLSVTGNQGAGSYTAALPIGFEFADGSNGGTGTIQLDIDERQTLDGTFTFTSAGGTSGSGTVSLVYHPLYERDSALATIAGTYTDAFAPGSDSLSIDAAGVLFAQADDTDCVVNGLVRIIDASYNAYSVTASFSGCTGVDAPLNGIAFGGILTLDNTSALEAIVGGLTATSGGNYFALVMVYERT